MVSRQNMRLLCYLAISIIVLKVVDESIILMKPRPYIGPIPTANLVGVK